MSNLKEIVGSLENKVSKLVHRLEGVKEESTLLKNELNEANKTCEYAKSQATYWEEKYNALKWFCKEEILSLIKGVNYYF